MKTSLVTMMLALAPLPACAAERPAAQAAVSHRDLDLASPAGRAALDGRILAKAARVCRDELLGSGWTPVEMHVCVLDAAARARAGAAGAIARAERRAHPVDVAAAR
jgi:UrcA family protein